MAVVLRYFPNSVDLGLGANYVKLIKEEVMKCTHTVYDKKYSIKNVVF